MIHLLKSLLLIGILYVTNTGTKMPEVKISCRELGLSFLIPVGFRSLDSSPLNVLSQRGDKAVKESFNKETLQGWQPACVNLQDSLKRSILMTAITVKEAITQDGSTDQFIAKTFKDANQFIIRRFKDRANIDIGEQQTV
ncbi:hypothetical protein [Paraflavitalea pollutisoli]|uniref:hypothetical protein n=1 Tax=Paraflavitalea pollutisoli TaxID=3034143 RepID=UPI0023EB4463|nr:hypothetical protein [Paraflavitalea sp. H1-2-19X]